MRKRNFKIFAAIVVVVVLGFWLRYAWSLMQLGAAYKAKILCSGVFVSHREAHSILNTDLAADDLSILRHIEAEIDTESKQVTADFLGIIERSAVYRPGLGCYLTYKMGGDLSGAGAITARKDTLGMLEKHDQRFDTVLDWAFSEPDPAHLRRTRAVVIIHKGQIVAERYAQGFSKDTPLLGWSMTKGIVNALVGLMVKEGRLSLQGQLPVPEWLKPDDPRRKITLSQLLQMSSGLHFVEDYGSPVKDVTRMLFEIPDMGAYAASMALEAKPGSKWSYSSGTTNIISRIIRNVLGDSDYFSFPRRALFEPLGMESAVLEPDASGTFVGSSFMYATARDWAKFGLLYLYDGVWAGKRIFPEGWVKYTTSPALSSPNLEYGAHFWLKLPDEYRGLKDKNILPGDAFHAVGYEGQFISIIPSSNLVVVRLGLTRFSSAWPHDTFISKVLEAVNFRVGSD